MAAHAVELFAPGARVLTHCNAGGLATGGYGTAVGAIRRAWEEGLVAHVWVDETRPLLQGARLTAWELEGLGVPHAVIADSAAASLMAAGEVDCVVTGADRIAANGDTANKIGTYALAVLARHHGIPLYVVAPTSTVDLATPTGCRDPDRGARPGRGHGPLPGPQPGVRRHAGGADRGDRDRGGRPPGAVRGHARVRPRRPDDRSTPPSPCLNGIRPVAVALSARSGRTCARRAWCSSSCSRSAASSAARRGRPRASRASAACARIRPPLCARCGAPTAWPVRRCAECAGRRLAFASARAAVVHDDAARALVAGWKQRGAPPARRRSRRGRRARRWRRRPAPRHSSRSRPIRTACSNAATIRRRPSPASSAARWELPLEPLADPPPRRVRSAASRAPSVVGTSPRSAPAARAHRPASCSSTTSTRPARPSPRRRPRCGARARGRSTW